MGGAPSYVGRPEPPCWDQQPQPQLLLLLLALLLLLLLLLQQQRRQPVVIPMPPQKKGQLEVQHMFSPPAFDAWEPKLHGILCRRGAFGVTPGPGAAPVCR